MADDAAAQGNLIMLDTPEAQPETQIVSDWKVACDGGVGGLGHPRVWLQIAPGEGVVECGYCGARYVHESRVESDR